MKVEHKLSPTHAQYARAALEQLQAARSRYLTAMGEAKEGANGFKVYATLDAPSQPQWRPGMQGEARVDVEKKPLVWVWTHRLIDFVRLKLWLPF